MPGGVRRAAYYLALAGMEIALWSLVLQLWQSSAGYALASLIGVAAMLLLSLAVNLYLGGSDSPNAASRWSAGLGILCGLLFTALTVHGTANPLSGIWRSLGDLWAAGFGEFRPSLFTFGLSLTLWWRGSALIRIPRTYRNVAFRFRLSVIVLLVLLLLRTTVPTESPQVYLVAFFAASLLALALARAEEVLQVPGGTPLTLGPSWIGWLIGATAATVSLGILAVRAVSFASLRTVLDWMQPVLRPIALAIYTFLFFLASLLEPLFQALITFLQQAPQDQLPSPASPPALGEMVPPAVVQWPAWLLFLLHALRWLAIAVVALLILWVLSQALSQHRRHTPDDTSGGQREALPRRRPRGRASARRVANALSAVIANTLRRWWQPRTPAEQVKWLYARLLRIASERDVPRPPGITPYEHQRTLNHALPGYESEIRTMTRAYVLAHYAEAEIDDALLEQVRQSWERVAGKQSAEK